MMNYNLIAYTIYLPVMGFITVFLGHSLFKNGRVFILNQLHNDESLTDFINRILLTGYYLVNLGYCIYIISEWNSLSGWNEIITSLSETIGIITLGLGVMHFVNIFILFLIRKNHNHINNNL